MKFNYVVVENKINGMDAIKLLDDPFAGIIFAYGQIKIDVDEDNDNIDINFEYEILEKNNKEFSDMAPFEKYIGNLLEHILHSGIEQESQIMH
jgi:hypothetical protein